MMTSPSETPPAMHSPSNLPVLITGATGVTGGAAIDALLLANRPVRAMVRTLDARSEALAARGVEIVQGELSDFDAVGTALKGTAAAYFVYPIQLPGILEATAYFAQAALEQGVGAVVNISQITARRESKSHAARNHWLAERLFDRSGAPVVHLRPTLFAEWLLYFASAIREKGILPLGFGEARYAPITGEDQGRVIAAILQNPARHVGNTYPLFGPVELTQYEVADLLTEVLGRKIAYVPVEIDAFVEILRGFGFGSHILQHLGAVAQDCRDGMCSGTNGLIEELTGQKGMGMREFILKNKASFQSAA